MRLFLFDVDGTLLTAQGAGRQAFARTLAAVYGTAGPVERYDFRGKTDLQILFPDFADVQAVVEALTRT